MDDNEYPNVTENIIYDATEVSLIHGVCLLWAVIV